MRSALLVSVLLLAVPLLSCASNGEGPREYDNNDLQLVTGYAAKEYCSCIFVMEQTMDFCDAWTKANPQVAKIRVDRDAKTVEASALVMWGAKARYTGGHFGCVLE